MNLKTPSGWERENRTLFDDIVTSFDKLRWDYPAELFEDIFQYAGADEGKRALEIGAGTGKATAPILDAGYSVTAIEIGKKMSDFLTERFKDNNRFSVINAAFEDVLFDSYSYDLVYAASSFHWVDAEIGCPKVYNLLKNGGVFALFRCNAVPPDDNELYVEVQAVYEKYYYSYYTENKRPARKAKEEYLKPEQVKLGWGFESMEQYGFGDIMMKLYESSRTYGADDYIELLDTYSDHRALSETNRLALYDGVKETITRHGGVQKLDFVYQLYMGRKM